MKESEKNTLNKVLTELEIQTSPELVIDKIIKSVKEYSVETNRIDLSVTMIVTDRNEIKICPMPSSGPMGQLLTKAYIKSLKNINVHTILELTFGKGVVKKVDKTDTEGLEKLKAEQEAYEKEAEDMMKSGIVPSEFSDFLMVNAFTKEHVNLSVYDVIQTTDHSATVISEKPIVEHKFNYKENKEFPNYFN